MVTAVSKTELVERTTERNRIPSVSVRKIINTLSKYSIHDMPTPICNGQNCKDSSHFDLKGCAYDLMLDLFGDLLMLIQSEIRESNGDILFKGHSDFVKEKRKQ